MIAGERETFPGWTEDLPAAGVEVRLLPDPQCIALSRHLQRGRADMRAEGCGA